MASTAEFKATIYKKGGGGWQCWPEVGQPCALPRTRRWQQERMAPRLLGSLAVRGVLLPRRTPRRTALSLVRRRSNTQAHLAVRLSSRAVLAPLLRSLTGQLVTRTNLLSRARHSLRSIIVVALPSSCSTLAWSTVVDRRSCPSNACQQKSRNCLSSPSPLSRRPFEPLLF